MGDNSRPPKRRRRLKLRELTDFLVEQELRADGNEGDSWVADLEMGDEEVEGDAKNAVENDENESFGEQ